MNAATDKSTMVTALETNASDLGINVTTGDYAALDLGKKQSVANFVLDRKGTEYQTEATVQSTFNAGLAYETAKVAFSTKLKSGTDVVSNDVEAMIDAYKAVETFDGEASEVITNNINILQPIVEDVNKFIALNDFAQLNGEPSPTNSAYTINVDSLTRFLTEFQVYITAAPALTNFNLQANVGELTGNFENGYVLKTDGNSQTPHVLTFNGTGFTKDLANTEVEVKLIDLGDGLTAENFTNPTTGYYKDKSEPYKTYLNNAIEGTEAFAYIIANNYDNTVRLQDAAQWDLNDNAEVGMVIPGDYPTGIYTLSFELEDALGNTETYTVTLEIDRSTAI
ncbi:hypothetical protein JOC78_001371 [Bacillus ectoiniformans]|nr:hypothetical protein [Bacillus ectoiniformans]